MPASPRQGRIAGWLKSNQSSVSALASHLGLSVAQASRHCNAKEVPVSVLDDMKSFQAPTGKHIPVSHLPKGTNKRPGPRKGWLEAKLARARKEAAAKTA